MHASVHSSLSPSTHSQPDFSKYMIMQTYDEAPRKQDTYNQGEGGEGQMTGGGSVRMIKINLLSGGERSGEMG